MASRSHTFDGHNTLARDGGVECWRRLQALGMPSNVIPERRRRQNGSSMLWNMFLEWLSLNNDSERQIV